MPIELEFPPIDPDIANEVNKFSLKKLEEDDNRGLYRTLETNVAMAPDFAIHAATLKIADAYRREGRLAAWIEKFNVFFPTHRAKHPQYKYNDPLIPFAKYEEMGLFIPRARKEKSYEFGTRDATALFNGHMANYARGVHGEWEQEITAYGTKVSYPDVIIDRHWTPYDFDNPELVRLARTKFIPNIWDGLKRHAEGNKRGKEKDADPVIDKLSDELYAYYLKISELCSRDE